MYYSISNKKECLKSHIDFGMFNKSIDYAENHNSLRGVNNILVNLQKKQQEFSKRCYDFIAEVNPSLDIAYEKYIKAANRADKLNRIRFLPIITFILFLIVELFLLDLVLDLVMPWSPFSPMLSMLLLVMMAISLAAIPIMLIICKILNFLADKKGKLYRTAFDDALKKIKSLSYPFDKLNRQLYQKVDNLYLASLEPTHREAILMRRSTESYQAEMLKSQKQLEKSSKHSVEEQKRIRIAEEEMLEYEREKQREKKEREKRSKRW